MNVVSFTKPKPLTPERWWLAVDKSFALSVICPTAQDAIDAIGDDTTGVLEMERDHQGKLHSTNASGSIADKWIEQYGEKTDLDLIPWFVKDNCQPQTLLDLEAKAFEAWNEEREQRSDYQHSVGIVFNR